MWSRRNSRNPVHRQNKQFGKQLWRFTFSGNSTNCKLLKPVAAEVAVNTKRILCHIYMDSAFSLIPTYRNTKIGVSLVGCVALTFDIMKYV